MVGSLQDQLKKSGLVDEKKAKQLQRAKQKEEKRLRQQQDKKTAAATPSSALSESKRAQVEKDKQLNKVRDEQALRKAIAAQIKQLIATHSVSLGGNEKEVDKKYSFADGSIVKHLWISAEQVDQLAAGNLVIVKDVDKYCMVPRVIAEKIEGRDKAAIIFKAERGQNSDKEDPYADYQIPDDLDW